MNLSNISIYQERMITIYRHSGIKSALSYCSGLFDDFFEICDSLCFLYFPKDNTVSTIAHLSFFNNLENQHGLSAVPTKLDVPDAFPRPSVDMQLDIPVVSKKYDNEQLKEEILQHISSEIITQVNYAIRLPLAIHKDFSIFMAFFIGDSQPPSKEQLEKCTELIAPLGKAVANNISNSLKASEGQLTGAGLEQCPDLSVLLERITRVASTNTSILIQGETGSGKALVASTIRKHSSRHDKAFIYVNCGGMPEELTNSLFFGHRRGAFTGAISNHSGYFERAHEGTLFLDEIGELSLTAQASLLHVLETSQIEPIGALNSIVVDIRLICATNRNLLEMLKQGTFREDLYYRISNYPIYVPPLRERRHDIEVLAKYFTAYHCKRFGFTPRYPSPADIKKLISYSWPGNVRELSQVIEQSIIDSKICDPRGDYLNFLDIKIPSANVHSKIQNSSIVSNFTDFKTLNEISDGYIELVMKMCDGRIAGENGAATILGVHPQTLYGKKVKKKKIKSAL